MDKNRITRELLKNSGISRGMRVLDFGCGNGEVSELILEIVGEKGEVVAVDINDRPLAVAEKRFAESKTKNIRVLNYDILSKSLDLGFFDAVVGRRVLMYLKNLNEVIGELSSLLAPDGIFAFQEIDSIVPQYSQNLQLHSIVKSWIWNTIEAEGADIHIGARLPQLLNQSGFEISNTSIEANIQGQNAHGGMEDIVRVITPRIVHHGIATVKDIEIDTLGERLAKEREHSEIFVSDMTISIIAQKK